MGKKREDKLNIEFDFDEELLLEPAAAPVDKPLVDKPIAAADKSAYAEVYELEKEMNVLKARLDTLKAKQDAAKAKVMRDMALNEQRVYTDDYASFTYVAETTRDTVDSVKLKAMFPEAYEQCKKTSKVKESLRVKILQ